MASISDREVQILAGISASLEADYAPKGADPWEASPFGWILKRPSRQRGAIGEQLVAGWCAAKGADVVRSRSSEADRIINGHRIEVKFSTLWQSGVYKFQQIRDQAYDQLLCIGVSPFNAHAWLLPKAVLLERVIGYMGQHTGASGRDTAWLSFPAGTPYEWMHPYGGTLGEAWAVLERLGHGRN